MLRWTLSGLAVVATLVLFALPASAQQRIALVIGNAAYPKGAIATSLADGGLVAEALTSIGFEIVEGADLNQADLRRLLRDFLQKVQAAGPDAIAVVYYTGYGIEFEGENHLVPVDARLERDSDIPIDAVRLFDLLRPLADTPAAAKIVILDATRPLPFQIQGGRLARGLGAIAAAPGMIVGFSSAPGTVAPDRADPYGAYATAIAEMVREPGLDLETMFARIRVRTHEATNGAQTPWNVSQGINPQIMLVPGAPAAPVVSARRAARPMRDVGPEQAYAFAIENDSLDDYSEYVRTYPDSAYAPRVWAIIRERREALAWRRALLINSPEAYWTYLARYPDGMYAFDAQRRLQRLSAGLQPPSGFRAMEFEDVPPPLDGEPARAFGAYPAAPPPPRFLGPAPAFITALPPPERHRGPGLWRRQTTFPVIIAPPGGPQFQRRGPAPVVNVPPGPPSSAPLVRGAPPPNFQRQGITGPTPGSPPPAKEFKKRGPTGTTTAPPGPPPKGLTTTTTPTTAPVVRGAPPPPPKSVTTTAPLIRGAPPPPPKSMTTTAPVVRGAPPLPPPQPQLRVAPPPKPVVTAPPPPPPPKAPVVRAPPPPPPPPPPQVRSAPPPPSSAKKCVVVNGQQQCK